MDIDYSNCFVHMLGVNGISMSGLAEILLDRGCRVSGSDLNASDRTGRLAESGAAIYIGNAASNIKADDPPDLLVYTAAAGPDNPERVRAAELGIPCIERAELLGRIMAEHAFSIGVAGTHGKTTTSAMIAAILLADGRDPTINIGGEYVPIGGNTRIGGRGIFLAEACEYTDTFLKLSPSIAVITNVEYDHSDYFRDIAHLRESFSRYARLAKKAVVANADDANARMVLQALAEGSAGGIPVESAGGIPERVLFGVESGDAEFRAGSIEYGDDYCATFTFSCAGSGGAARVNLRVPGLYNVYNALAAGAAAVTAGCSLDAVVAGLEGFCGVKKRFEYKGEVKGVKIIDDYAHHPSEVGSALESAKRYARGGKVFCVFHPHTYTRTRTFLREFAAVFASADHVLLADIFPAREKDPGDISSAILADEINKAGGNALYFAGGFPDIAAYILEAAAPGDLALTMGAGLASDVADILLSGH